MPNFEEIYGMTWKQMDEDQRMMAVLGTFHDVTQELKAINERLDDQNGKVKCIPGIIKVLDKHQIYFILVGIVVLTIIIPLAVAFLKAKLGL